MMKCNTLSRLTLMFFDVFLEVEWLLKVCMAVRTGVQVEVMAVHVFLEVIHLSKQTQQWELKVFHSHTK